jgi:cation diffusion facilitator CzcD-associated flavoprotein CzcO
MTIATASAEKNVRPEISVDVVVVGAGFAGMYALYCLRKLGMSARVYEAGTDVGGTWYWNRYPGARCDVESMQYSYSFSEELQQEWNWTERFSTQPEILRYAQHVAERFELKRDIQFETRVTSATFDEAANRWKVRTDAGDAVSARFCIMATGCLSAPRTPDIPGIATFGGKTYHTAQWPREGVSFAGKRVGVIGTGSTGIQMIPRVAAEAAHVTVFQRTANFSLPAHNGPLPPEVAAETKRNYAQLRQQMRTSPSGTTMVKAERSALSVSQAERLEWYQHKWDTGGTHLVGSFSDLMTDLEANATAAEFVRNNIRQIVKDPTTAEALAPKDHPIGTKRICVDTGYFEVYNRDNVTLVDLKADPIEQITESSVRTRGASYDVDCLIYATGFDAITGALLNIDIRGRGGRQLTEKWAAGPRTYLGLGTAGFPNLFMVTGPGSPSVLSNMIVSIEQHIDWITQCMNYLKEHGLDRIEPREDAEDAWVIHVNEVANQTLYNHANSWYLGANVPGKTRVFMPYVGGVGAYRQKCDEVAANGYQGFTLSAVAVPAEVAANV